MQDNDKAVILTIDDDPVILNTLISILKASYEVKPFACGSTALKYLARNSADLVLLDCNMPEMTGFDVLRQLQQEPALHDIPVIFLTGAEDGESEVEALEAGAADFIRKPIQPKALMTRVRLQLELQRYRDRMENLVEEKTRSLLQAYDQLTIRENVTLNLLAKTTDLRDQITGDHIWRVTEYVRIIVGELLVLPRLGYELTPAKGEEIVKSSKLHDLGKIAIPDSVLLKLGRLTEQEFEVIKLHPVHGAQLLDEFIDQLGDDSFLTTARDITLHHHEKWNGDGYPYGFAGATIPLSARIVAIGDVYDALISVRPYKRAFTHEESVAIIVKDGNRHFDPYLTTVFEHHAEEFRAVSTAAVKKTSHFTKGG